jgi:cell division protein FtsL
MQDKASKDEVKLLRAQIGNLEVQVADYQQIVKDLSDKLRLYETKYGTVFRSARNTSTQK